jgi:hypothetical protein
LLLLLQEGEQRFPHQHGGGSALRSHSLTHSLLLLLLLQEGEQRHPHQHGGGPG